MRASQQGTYDLEQKIEANKNSLKQSYTKACEFADTARKQISTTNTTRAPQFRPSSSLYSTRSTISKPNYNPQPTTTTKKFAPTTYRSIATRETAPMSASTFLYQLNTSRYSFTRNQHDDSDVHVNTTLRSALNPQKGSTLYDTQDTTKPDQTPVVEKTETTCPYSPPKDATADSTPIDSILETKSILKGKQSVTDDTDSLRVTFSPRSKPAETHIEEEEDLDFDIDINKFLADYKFIDEEEQEEDDDEPAPRKPPVPDNSESVPTQRPSSPIASEEEEAPFHQEFRLPARPDFSDLDRAAEEIDARFRDTIDAFEEEEEASSNIDTAAFTVPARPDFSDLDQMASEIDSRLDDPFDGIDEEEEEEEEEVDEDKEDIILQVTGSLLDQHILPPSIIQVQIQATCNIADAILEQEVSSILGIDT